MNELVLDASVILKWFAGKKEPGFYEASKIRALYEAGDLLVVVPPLLFLEILNIAGRRWSWGQPELHRLASAMEELGFDVVEPRLRTVSSWVAEGLTAYDAVYVALAEERGATLLTDDKQVIEIAQGVALALRG